MAAIRVVRRADAPGAAVDHEVDELLGGAVEGLFEAHSVFKVVALESSGADAGLLDGFLAGLGYVDGHDQPPLMAVHGLAVLLGDVQGDLPEGVEFDGFGAARPNAEREDGGAMLAGQLHARRRLGGGDGDGEVGLGVGPQVGHGPLKREPLRLISDRLGFGEQPHDDPEGFVHAGALRERFDAQHVGVGDQRAGPHAQHDPPAGDVVQLDHAVGDHERVVVGEADDAGAELDVAGAFGGGGDEEFGRGDGLPAGAVVFADPGFVVAQMVEPLEGFKVALEAEGGVFAEPVEGGQKDSELHAWGQWHLGAPLAGSGLELFGRNDTAGWASSTLIQRIMIPRMTGALRAFLAALVVAALAIGCGPERGAQPAGRDDAMPSTIRVWPASWPVPPVPVMWLVHPSESIWGSPHSYCWHVVDESDRVCQEFDIWSGVDAYPEAVPGKRISVGIESETRPDKVFAQVYTRHGEPDGRVPAAGAELSRARSRPGPRGLPHPHHWAMAIQRPQRSPRSALQRGFLRVWPARSGAVELIGGCDATDIGGA